MPGARREIVDAARDLLGVVRALGLLERDPQNRERLDKAATTIEESGHIFAIDDPGAGEYEAAVDKLRAAIQSARSTIHMNNGPLGMLLGAAVKQLRELQGRSY